MNRSRRLVIAASLILSGQIASAQDMARYRVYALESNVASVIAASGAPSADAKTIHKRPATIQELQWRGAVRHLHGHDGRSGARHRIHVLQRRALSGRRQLRPRPHGKLTDKDILDALTATSGAPGPPICRRRGRALRQTHSPTASFSHGGRLPVVDDAPPSGIPRGIPADPAFETVAARLPRTRSGRRSGWMRSMHHAANPNSAKKLATPSPLATRRAALTKPHFALEPNG